MKKKKKKKNELKMSRVIDRPTRGWSLLKLCDDISKHDERGVDNHIDNKGKDVKKISTVTKSYA